MDNKPILKAAVLAALGCSLAGAQLPPLDRNIGERLDSMSNSELIAMANHIMDQGVPAGEPASILGILASTRSSLSPANSNRTR